MTDPELPFVRRAHIDKPGIIGAQWLQDSVASQVPRRAALKGLLALAQIPIDYTGGSHRSMGIMPPSRVEEAGVDYGEVIRGLDADGFRTFAALADDPRAIDPARRAELEFGEEREIPLSRRQMLWLERRH